MRQSPREVAQGLTDEECGTMWALHRILSLQSSQRFLELPEEYRGLAAHRILVIKQEPYGCRVWLSSFGRKVFAELVKMQTKGVFRESEMRR